MSYEHHMSTSGLFDVSSMSFLNCSLSNQELTHNVEGRIDILLANLREKWSKWTLKVIYVAKFKEIWIYQYLNVVLVFNITKYVFNVRLFFLNKMPHKLFRNAISIDGLISKIINVASNLIDTVTIVKEIKYKSSQ